MTSLSQALYSNLLLDIEPHVSGRAFSHILKREVSFFPGVTAKDAACMLLMSNVLKKFEDDATLEADQVALNKFLQCNLQCKEWAYEPENLFDEVLMCTFKQCMWDFFNRRGDRDMIFPDNLVELIKESDLVGPGASVGASGQDFYTKLFSSRLTGTTEILYVAYSRYVSTLSESWKAAEGLRAQHYGRWTKVGGNRLSFVPKSEDTSRTICTEPSLNMVVQKGIGNIIERRLRSVFGIDLKVQQARNRELARIGSLDNSMVTIDLSSASDTISLRMLEWALPQSVTALLKVCRSSVTTLPDGSELQLEMVSTMGNGFTFPLQTAIFCCVLQAVALTTERCITPPKGDELGDFGVNGDDIVCRREMVSGVVRLINLLGFQVNTAKSFVEGPFRESCGGDFFQGSPVRAVYLKTLSDPQSRYKAINRLVDWSAQQGIPLCSAVDLLLRTVRPLPVPKWEQDVAGIKVPWSLVRGLRRSKKTKSVLYRRYVFEPVKLKIGDCDISVPGKSKRRIYNPHGLLLAFLHGSVKGSTREGGLVGSISIRHDAGGYRTKWGTAPNWDCTSTDKPFPDEDSRRRWESVAEMCLSSTFSVR